MNRAENVGPSFLTSALDGGEWSTSRPCRFNPGETDPGSYWTRRWLGPRIGMDVMENRKISCSYPESNLDSSVVQPVDRLSVMKKIWI
jgi:hypothetical protein